MMREETECSQGCSAWSAVPNSVWRINGPDYGGSGRCQPNGALLHIEDHGVIPLLGGKHCVPILIADDPAVCVIGASFTIIFPSGSTTAGLPDRMTIYKMLKEESIPASRIGHQWRFFREDIDAWIRSKKVGPLPDA